LYHSILLAIFKRF